MREPPTEHRPNEQSAGDLLRQFAETGSESCFRQLVEIYAGMVFASAWRRVDDRELAEEITQNVFTALAKKAAGLRAHPSLSAWLFSATRLEANSAMKSERRRQRKLAALSHHTELQASRHPIHGQDLVPGLDSALDQLRPGDRRLILWRYYDRLSYGEIAKLLGKSEPACRKQASRSLEKLGGILRRRGVAIPSATALTATLGTPLGKAATPGFTAAVSKAAVAQATMNSAGSLTHTLPVLMACINTKSTLTAAALLWLACVGSGFWLGREKAEAATRSVQPSSSRLALPWQTREAASEDASNHSTTPSDPHLLSNDELVRLLTLAHDDFKRNQVDGASSHKALLRIRAIPPEQLEEALSLIEKIPGDGVDLVYLHAVVAGRWAEYDGAAAMAYATERLDGRKRTWAIKEVIRGWANQKPGEVLTWIEESKGLVEERKILTRGELEQHLNDVFLRRARLDIDEAFTRYAQLDDPDLQAQAFSGLAQAVEDPDLRAALLTRLPEIPETQRGEALNRIGKTWAWDNPAEAARWIETVEAPLGSREQIDWNIFNAWRHSEPNAAGDWFAARSPEDSLSTRLNQIAANWPNRDYAAARAWLEKGEFGEVADEAVANMVSYQYAGRKKPEESLELAGMIVSEERRRSTLNHLFQWWTRVDGEAARTHLDSAALPEGDADYVRAQFGW